jgi:hypothetical protein
VGLAKASISAPAIVYGAQNRRPNPHRHLPAILQQLATEAGDTAGEVASGQDVLQTAAKATVAPMPV